MKNYRAIFRHLTISFCAFISIAAAHADDNKLNVGATATGTPFTFLDVKTNTIQGAMIDIVQALAKAGNFEVNIQQTNFSALIPSLTSNKIDLISAAMLKTDERAKVVSFSAPVYSYGEGVMINTNDTGSYTNIDALKGKIVGAQTGTIFYDILTKAGVAKEIRTYDSIADMAHDLALGRIDAAMGDAPIMAYYIQQNVFKNVKLASEFKPAHVSDVCIILRKDDTANMTRINKAIETIKENGTLAAILKKWGI